MKREDHNAPISSLPLFADAARARRKDPETSHEAARKASTNLRDSQEFVLWMFREFGEMTDEQLIENYNNQSVFPAQSDSGLRTRRHELVLLGKIVYSGRRDESVGDRRVKPRIWRLSIAEAKSA